MASALDPFMTASPLVATVVAAGLAVRLQYMPSCTMATAMEQLADTGPREALGVAYLTPQWACLLA